MTSFEDFHKMITETHHYIRSLEDKCSELQNQQSYNNVFKPDVVNLLRKHFISNIYVPTAAYIVKDLCGRCDNGIVNSHISKGYVHKTVCTCRKSVPNYYVSTYPVLECTEDSLVYDNNGIKHFIPITNVSHTFTDSDFSSVLVYDNIDACQQHCNFINGGTDE